MALSKYAFFSAMEPWRGKRFLVLVVSGRVEFRLWATLENMSADGVFTFARRNEESLGIDLGGNESFSWERGGAELVPAIFREAFDKSFSSSILAKMEGELRAVFIFPREALDT